MSRIKSIDEAPWDAFNRTMGAALKRASGGLRRRTGRSLVVGSPVRVASAGGDIVRFPIELHGGEREYAVATVLVTAHLKQHYDEHRLDQIAREATTSAEAHISEPPAKPGSLVLTYP